MILRRAEVPDFRLFSFRHIMPSPTVTALEKKVDLF